MQKWLCVHVFLWRRAWVFSQQIPKGDSAPQIMNKKQNQSQRKSKPLEIHSKDSKSCLLCFLDVRSHFLPSLCQSLPFLLSLCIASDPFSSQTSFCTISCPPSLPLYFLVSISGLFFLHFLIQQTQALVGAAFTMKSPRTELLPRLWTQLSTCPYTLYVTMCFSVSLLFHTCLNGRVWTPQYPQNVHQIN